MIVQMADVRYIPNLSRRRLFRRSRPGVSDAFRQGDDHANPSLTLEDREGLIPSYIALRAELTS